jgi:2-polyprenyl-6-methoxyphenol hydroxylase-like FAD-dependent oxidoreductase
VRPDLGLTVETNAPRYGRAVVAGGSIAGLVAARVLSDHFDEVVVIERDALPDGPEHRRGAPQAHHYHGLLARGMQVLEDLFPDFRAGVEAQGGQMVAATEELHVRRRIGWLPKFSSSLEVLLASRSLIEWAIRSRVLAIPNVRLVTATVDSLTATPDGGNVTGVQIGFADHKAPAVISCDLVVDTTGRASSGPKWLASLGYGPVEETVVNAHWAYSSCFVQAPVDHKMEYKAISAPPLGSTQTGMRRTRGAAFWVQEGERRFILTAIGSAGDHPPANADGILAYVRDLDYPELTAALAGVELISDVHTWRSTPNRLRHYDRLNRRPENFVALGDAVAAFNPVYGQGMTVAILAAVDLGVELTPQRNNESRSLAGLAGRFHNRLADTVRVPWGMATGADYRVSGVTGEPQSDDAAQLTAYFDRLEALGSEDLEVCLAYLETAHLVRSADWLMSDSLRQRINKDWRRLGDKVGATDTAISLP